MEDVLTTYRVTLTDERSGIITFRALWKKIKPLLKAGKRVHGEFSDGRTPEQDRLCHSCYRDLARDALLGGRKATAEEWKESLKYCFWLTTRDDPDFADDWRGRAPTQVPLVDGDGYVLTPVSSKRFNRRLYGAFITFVHQTGDARGVQWSKTSLGRDWPEHPEGT